MRLLLPGSFASRSARAAALLATLALLSCRPVPPPPRSHPAGGSATGGATPSVRQANAAAARGPELAGGRDHEDARRGFVAAPAGQVKGVSGEVLWDFDAFAFVKGEAPDTVHPGLWRQAALNNQVGLFKVVDGIWQLRGFDLANVTLVEGQTGWIVVDALTSRETAAAAMAFARLHLGDRPVTAVVFTHSHADHFGGVLGVLSAEEARARRVPIVAPAGFLEEATSENVLVGTAMVRRSAYMYGDRLRRDARGLVDNGIGKAVAYGSVGILPPTVHVPRGTVELVLDGRRFVFHDVGGSEAPAELVFYLPDAKAFGGSELVGHTLHNLHTPRGAKVRDALRWAGYIDEALGYAAEAEVLFTQHNWPVWGRERVAAFLRAQRDVYRYIHDQTVRLMNAGLTAPEIAEVVTLPPSLQEHAAVHGYYGTVRHNVKAVYQHYLGWFDGHPANLDPLPPAEAGARYATLAGGVDRLVASASQAFEAGEFRWAAELAKHAVHADRGNPAATELLARSFEQLAYLAESAPWRNFYLTGALELREGPPSKGRASDQLLEMLEHTPLERFLDRMAGSVDGPRAAGTNLKVNLVLTDLDESWVLHLENGVLHHRRAPPSPDAAATLSVTKRFFLRMMTGQAGAKGLLLSDEARVRGSTVDLARFLALLDKAPGNFPVVTR